MACEPFGSGGVERNAIIGDNAEARKADIPIVQLNPGGTLNYKYMGETAVRGAGVPYTVIRSTGVRHKTYAACLVTEDSTGGDLYCSTTAQGGTLWGIIRSHMCCCFNLLDQHC